ncbi:extracellular solute-binding protein [Paenibacillus taichungensis]|uniref:ABC transporter substrate-binding protein n=1 Tax=Paenibacillus taichungensis TaxID=484184 RepID=UPI002871AB50|nr:extracellular solute-binding protein [Paenibacillus taichungensis]MDR9746091.1 extracellular solute-binding protein [Paenibacillus taichungensis]MEC0111062.1 extracellular solute-binding protein [Paenibacillus taichungensis]MEC0196923.1 extracellular solute-binding protein [Paenibacillus taichungensis]
MKRSAKLSVTAMLLMSIILTACGKENVADNGNSSKSDVVKIEFFQQQGEEAIQNAYHEIIADFTKEYPNIEINMNTVPDPVKVLTSRFATNDIPPLFTDFPTQLQFKEKVKNGYIENLSDQPFIKDVNEKYLDMTVADDGGYYSLPYARNYMAVYYNINLFEQNNVKIPTTYAEFIEACKLFQSKGITPLYLPLKDVGHIFQATNIAFAPGGVEEMVKVAKGEGQVEGNPEFLVFAKKLRELTQYANKDAFGVSAQMMQEAFANGQAAMIISGSYGRGNIKVANPNLKFGAFPLPNDTVDTTTALSGVNASLSISAKAKPEEKEAALTFLKYIARPEVAQKWSDLSGEPSIIKGTTYGDQYLQPILDFIDNGRVHDWMSSTLESAIVTELYSTTQGYLINNETPEQYLKNIDETIKLNAVK